MYKLGRKNYEVASNCMFNKLNTILIEHPTKPSIIIKNETKVIDNVDLNEASLDSVIKRYVYDILNYALGYRDYIDYFLCLDSNKQVSFNDMLRENGFCI